MKPVIEPSGLCVSNVTDVTLQPDIQIETENSGHKIYGVEQTWIKTRLTPAQRAKFRKWEKARTLHSKLFIQNLESGETKNVRINSIIYISSTVDSLGYMNSHSDSLTGTTYYTSKAWILKSLNKTDSTLEINDYPNEISAMKIKYTEIKFISAKHLRGRYKVLGIGK
jgi:hypothetical protein